MVHIQLLEADELALRRSPASPRKVNNVEILHDGEVIATAIDRSPNALPFFQGLARSLQRAGREWDVLDAAGGHLFTVVMLHGGIGRTAMAVTLADGSPLGHVDTRGTIPKPVWELCRPQGEPIGTFVLVPGTSADRDEVGEFTGAEIERVGVLRRRPEPRDGYDLSIRFEAGSRLRSLMIAQVLTLRWDF